MGGFQLMCSSDWIQSGVLAPSPELRIQSFAKPLHTINRTQRAGQAVVLISDRFLLLVMPTPSGETRCQHIQLPVSYMEQNYPVMV